jgi:hypothetical protein
MMICYTNNKIWFSGLCLSTLHFNVKRSDNVFYANACSSNILPFYTGE